MSVAFDEHVLALFTNIISCVLAYKMIKISKRLGSSLVYLKPPKLHSQASSVSFDFEMKLLLAA